MVKKINTILIIFYLIPSALLSQNLVPNSSFEQYDTCPTSTAQIYRAIPWFQPNTCCGPGGSSDYFNQCVIGNPWIDVPQNNFGFQQARTGVAYAGIATIIIPSVPNNYREYIEVQLNDSLVTGKMYCVEFYVSLANSSKYASNNIGAYFSNNIIQYSNINFIVILVTPQINENNIIYDTTNWVKISGSFVANGGEKYMAIGNFYNDTGTNIDTLTEWNDHAYYFIDDISVTPSVTANAGADVSITQGQNTTLNANGGGIYSWYPSTGLSCTSCPNPAAYPSITTTYYVVVSDSFACGNDTDSVTVFVTPAPENNFYVPNAFSPNEDGENDLFFVQGNLTELHCEIYNRWGEKVAELTKINESWDGTVSGQKCNTGVYLYYLTAKTKDGKEITKKGNITLLR